MPRTRTTTVLGSTAAAALLALTAACGSSGSGGDAGGSGGSGGSSGSGGSGDSGSSAQGASLTKDNFYSSVLAAQKKAGSYTFDLTLDTNGQKITGTGEADTSSTPAAAHVTLGVGGQKIETITTDGLIYLKGGAFGTAKWIKIDPKAKNGLGALMGASGGGQDPASQLATLKDASTVKKGGSKDVNGVATTEYDVSVPGSAVAKSSSAASQLKQYLPKTITYTLFVDKDNLVRELTNSLKVKGQSVTTTVDFDDYGKDVSVEAPPASQVTEKAPNLGGSLGG